MNNIQKFSLCLTENTIPLHYKSNKVMVFRDIIAVYSENHTRHINTHLPSDPKCVIKFPTMNSAS